MFLQLVGTAVGTKFALPYACLSVGYLEETILFLRLLPLHFTLTKCSNKDKHVAKEPYFKVYAFMTVNNENKLLCYES